MASRPTTQNHQEHPLANILLNVIVPVVVLSYLSKDPALQTAPKFYHLGPVKAILIALALPLGYGVWHFAKTRKWNFFSGIGLVSVLLTGALTLYLWNQNGTVKPHAGLLFGLKEALIPLLLGGAILWSQRTDSPLIRVFLYNDSIFDIPKIEQRVSQLQVRTGYDQLLAGATRLFALSFFLSAVLNLVLAQWFFHGFDETAGGALETYNGIVARITGWGFLVIGLPLMVFLFLTLSRLLKGLRTLTGLTDKEIMLPR